MRGIFTLRFIRVYYVAQINSEGGTENLRAEINLLTKFVLRPDKGPAPYSRIATLAPKT